MNATPDSTLANTERLVADLQRQLAECKAERDAGLERETATAEVLQAINSSPGNLAPVFDTILEKAHALCGAAHGGLLLRDGQQFRLAAVHAESRVAEYWRQLGPITPLSDGDRPLSQLMRGERVIHIPNIRESETYGEFPEYRRLIELGGIHTLLILPLRKNRALLGAITAYRQEVRPFSDKQIALLENFAAQAVIAIENARLITETREALEQQTATAEVLQVINSSPGDLGPVFDAMLEKALGLCDAQFGGISTYNGEGYHSVARRGHTPAFMEFQQSFGGVPSPLSGIGGSLEGNGSSISSTVRMMRPIGSVTLNGLRQSNCSARVPPSGSPCARRRFY